MTEAAKILNVSDKAPKDVVQANYKHLFDVNDPKVGGSHFLQSAVYRSFERFELQWKATEGKKGL